MDDNRRYEAFVRNRITELREQKGISEHRMSLELGKSGSYIRSITNGISMPSLRELFNIMEYFDLTPTLFFAPMDDPDSLRGIIGKKLLALPDEDLEKVAVFLDWIRKYPLLLACDMKNMPLSQFLIVSDMGGFFFALLGERTSGY